MPQSSDQASADAKLERISRYGDAAPTIRTVAVERPVAIEIDGLSYAVLMASLSDAEDLGIGFALSERLADSIHDVVEVEVHRHPDGLIVRLTLSPRVAGRTADRIRHRVSESACGLCGVENLEQAMRPLPRVQKPFAGSPNVVFDALEAIRDWQSLNRATGAVHAAALCSADGAVSMVREDVGRHNAFDKLIGAMARQGATWNGGFALLTSRCSFELVEKAVIAQCPMLATMSAPTSLALDRAARAGLPLVTLARADTLLFAP